MINHEYKCIFVHVIKTGGASIATALNMKEDTGRNVTREEQVPHYPKCHLSAKEIRKTVGEEIWNSYFKFSFVRNPYDKVVSQYHFNRGQWKLENASFKEYVNYWKNGGQISTFPQYHSHYLNEELDFIGRFENIQQDFNTICNKIGIPLKKLPHINKSRNFARDKAKHKHYTEYYDEETKQIVAKKYAKDIEYFKYTFN